LDNPKNILVIVQYTTQQQSQKKMKRKSTTNKTTSSSQPITNLQPFNDNNQQLSDSEDADELEVYTSMRVFRKFIVYEKDVNNPDLVAIDASGVISLPCYELWLKTRRQLPSDPPKAFHRTLSAHITGMDGRSPFSALEEKAILHVVRQKRPWPCFVGDAKHYSHGSQGFRARGWHEKNSTNDQETPSVSISQLMSEQHTSSSAQRATTTTTATTTSSSSSSNTKRQKPISSSRNSSNNTTTTTNNNLGQQSTATSIITSYPQLLSTGTIPLTLAPPSSSSFTPSFAYGNNHNAPPLLTTSSSTSTSTNSSSTNGHTNNLLPGFLPPPSSSSSSSLFSYVSPPAASAAAPTINQQQQQFSPQLFSSPYDVINQGPYLVMVLAQQVIERVGNATSQVHNTILSMVRMFLLSEGWFTPPDLQRAETIFNNTRQEFPDELVMVVNPATRNPAERFLFQSENSIPILGKITNKEGGVTRHLFPTSEAIGLMYAGTFAYTHPGTWIEHRIPMIDTQGIPRPGIANIMIVPNERLVVSRMKLIPSSSSS
jgi:hypothetical protein